MFRMPFPLARAARLRPLIAIGVMCVLCWPAAAGSASAAVPGLQAVSAHTAFSSSSKTVTATCPNGKQVLGAGDAQFYGAGDIVLEDLHPDASLTKVTTQALEDQDGTTASWYVQAYALCANRLPGLERVASTGPLNSENKSWPASCPVGKQVVGTGGDINAGSGQVEMDDIVPDPSLTKVTVQGIEDQDGYSGPWSLTAYAVCANRPAGLERASASSALTSSSKNISAFCTSGKKLIGVGGQINGGNGQVVRSGLVPDFASSPTLTSSAIGGWEDDDGDANPWSLTSYSICATP